MFIDVFQENSTGNIYFMEGSLLTDGTTEGRLEVLLLRGESDDGLLEGLMLRDGTTEGRLVWTDRQTI